MPDKYDFDHLPNRGHPEMRCIHCLEGGHMSYFPEETRKSHFLSHMRDRAAKALRDNPFLSPVIKGESRTTTCRTCGSEFEQERKRGRPRVFCYGCVPPKEAVNE